MGDREDLFLMIDLVRSMRRHYLTVRDIKLWKALSDTEKRLIELSLEPESAEIEKEGME